MERYELSPIIERLDRIEKIDGFRIGSTDALSEKITPYHIDVVLLSSQPYPRHLPRLRKLIWSVSTHFVSTLVVYMTLLDTLRPNYIDNGKVSTMKRKPLAKVVL